MTISEKLTLIAENQDKLYTSGQKSVGPVRAVTGNLVRMEYVNSTTHKIDVSLTSDTLTDFTGVKVHRFGKNLLHLDGRQVVDFGAYSNTTKRTFTGNGIMIGITNNNYYKPANCADVVVDNGIISGTNSVYGYGVGFDIRVVPGTYTLSWSELTGRASVTQYGADGTFLTAKTSSTNGQTISINQNTAWCIVNFQSLNANEPFKVVNPQFEFGTLGTAYEDGIAPVEYAANADGIVEGIESLSPTTVLITSLDTRINAKYIVVNDYEWNTFWDSLQHNGDGTADYRSMFFYWENDIYKPKYPIYSTKNSMTSAFANARIESTLVDVDLSKTTNCNSLFNYCSRLHTIPKLIVAEQNTFVSAFVGCAKLVNITVEGTFGNSIDFSPCPLSKDSILSILNALSITKTDQTVTFNKNAVNAAFTDDEWNTLVATKTNWTIALA